MITIAGTIQEILTFNHLQNYYGGLTIFRTEDAFFWGMGSHVGMSLKEIDEDFYNTLKEKSDGREQDKYDELYLIAEIIKDVAPDSIRDTVDVITTTYSFKEDEEVVLKGISPSFSVKKVDGHVVVRYKDSNLNLWVVVEDVGWPKEVI